MIMTGWRYNMVAVNFFKKILTEIITANQLIKKILFYCKVPYAEKKKCLFMVLM